MRWVCHTCWHCACWAQLTPVWPMLHMQGTSRRFGFALFGDRADADAAMAAIQGYVLKGRPIAVKLAVAGEPMLELVAPQVGRHMQPVLPRSSKVDQLLLLCSVIISQSSCTHCAPNTENRLLDCAGRTAWQPCGSTHQAAPGATSGDAPRPASRATGELPPLLGAPALQAAAGGGQHGPAGVRSRAAGAPGKQVAHDPLIRLIRAPPHQSALTWVLVGCRPASRSKSPLVASLLALFLSMAWRPAMDPRASCHQKHQHRHPMCHSSCPCPSH